MQFGAKFPIIRSYSLRTKDNSKNKGFFHKNARTLVIFVFLLTATLFIMPGIVHAEESCGLRPSTWPGCAVNWANKTFLSVLGAFISYAAKALAWAVGPDVQAWVLNFNVVTEGWTIIRNFVNMFFILFLIIMAFGTIFDIQRYKWDALLPKLIIAALLVNFSLAIGKYVISLGNGLAQVLLAAISGFATDLGSGFGLGTLLPSNQTGAVSLVADSFLNGGGGLLISLIAGLIFAVIVILSLVSALFFVVIRIPVLWILLIVSPIAWLSYVLPNTRATWSKWWSYLISWTFFLPVYLFFLMFAVMFIANKGKVTLPPVPGTTATSVLFGPGSAIDTLLFYILTIFFLLGGLRYSFKVGSLAAGGAGALMGRIEAGVRKYAPGAAYVRGAKEGLKERAEEIKEKGVFGIGGAQRGRIQEARAKGWFAPAPTTGEMERRKAESAEVDKEVKKLQALNLSIDQLNERLAKGGKFEQIAALKLKAENGWLEAADADKVSTLVRNAGGGRTALGASIISSLKKGKFHEMAKSTKEKEDIFNKFSKEDVELAKAFGLDMAESREVMDQAIAEKILALYEGDTKEIQDKVAEAVKGNIDNFAKDKSAREAIINTAITPTTTKAQKKMMALTAKTMADKKEVDSWATRRRVLELNGGVNAATGDAATAEGRSMMKEINDSNRLFKAEKDYRDARGIHHAVDLSSAQRLDVQRQIEADITAGLITGLSAEEMKTPEVFNAINALGAATPPARMAGFRQKMLGKKPDRKKREAFDKALAGPSIRY